MKYLKPLSIFTFCTLLICTYHKFTNGQEAVVENEMIDNAPKKRSIASIKIPMPLKKAIVKTKVKVKKKILKKQIKKKPKKIVNQKIKDMIFIYDKMSNFPDTSTPLKNITKTTTERKYTVKKQLISSVETPGLQARSWPNRNYNYLPGQTPSISIQVLQNGKLIQANIEAKLYDEKNQLIKKILLKNNGGLTYHSEFKNLEEGSYFLKYKASPKGNGGIVQAVQSVESFKVLKQNISFEGKMKDYLTPEGNLMIEAYIDVLEDGNYILESVCYNSKDLPVALAERIFTLKKGKQWVKYDYHGYIFTHAKEEGKFQIKHLSISRVAENLKVNAGKPFNPKHKTSSYEQIQFNKNSFQNFELINKKKKLTAYLSR